mgnify:CR=1 FL=1
MTGRIILTREVKEQTLLVQSLANSLRDLLGAAAPNPGDLLEALADTGIQLRADTGDIAFRAYRHMVQRNAQPTLAVVQP